MSSSPSPLLLITGATGKVGRHLCEALLGSAAHANWRIRALCHSRTIDNTPRIESVKGSIADRSVVERAMQGVTHVVHLATCKETPEDVMDVTVKGLFWLLESARQSLDFRQFVLIGGDAALGHFVYPHPLPVTEEQTHSAYKGCYALSKVLEEVMLEQYQIAYDLNSCCLRAPWIMEKDDFKYQLSFGDDVFGGPRWRDLVGAARADEYVREGRVPVMLDPAGQPVQRNFVHVSDLVSAILISLDHPRAEKQTFNVCCDEPVNYRLVAEQLLRTRNVPSVDVPTPYYSTWLDNAKAKFLLGWRPQYDYRRLVDEAYDYQRAAGDPRRIWYPG